MTPSSGITGTPALPSPLVSTVLVAVGGAVGAVARFWVVGLTARFAGLGFPWGTLIVNLLGCLLIGLLGAHSIPRGDSDAAISASARLLLIVGVLGGFTTFSAFGWETLGLLQAGRHWATLLYMAASVFLGVAATWAGWMLGGGAGLVRAG